MVSELSRLEYMEVNGQARRELAIGSKKNLNNDAWGRAVVCAGPLAVRRWMSMHDMGLLANGVRGQVELG